MKNKIFLVLGLVLLIGSVSALELTCLTPYKNCHAVNPTEMTLSSDGLMLEVVDDNGSFLYILSEVWNLKTARRLINVNYEDYQLMREKTLQPTIYLRGQIK